MEGRLEREGVLAAPAATPAVPKEVLTPPSAARYEYRVRDIQNDKALLLQQAESQES